MSKAIVWFRNNLRVSDNEPLLRATREAEEIIPIYIIGPEIFAQDVYGYTRTGSFRSQFLFECLKNLSKKIQEKGGKLYIAQGKPEDVLPEISKKNGYCPVYAPAEFTFDERQTEAELSKLVPLKLFWESSLIHPQNLPFEIEKLPDVFSSFRQEVESKSTVHQPLLAPERIKTCVVENLGHDFSVFNQSIEPHPKACMHFIGGEDEANKRLHHYLWQSHAIASYKETRNGMLGADYSSKFSPWLASGSLSARTIYHEIKKYEAAVTANESTYWLIFELLWRDFFRFVALKFGARLFWPCGLKQEPLAHRNNEIWLQRWRTGTTGEPFVDAHMRELLNTGFMSNRGRQNVASYLLHDLHQDWRAGAAWFEHLLIDYDPASNYGNWLYVAGLGNDPRPNRKFNVQRQAEMYDPKRDYVKHWLG